MLARRAEHAEGGVPFEFVHPPAVHGHDVYDDAEEAVQRLDDVARLVIGHEGGGADEVDEQHGGVTRLASEREPAPECRAGDLLPDVATEQVAHAVALPEPGDHPV